MDNFSFEVHADRNKRWDVNLDSLGVTHENGFVATFLVLPVTETSSFPAEFAKLVPIGTYAALDGCSFGIVTTVDMLQSVFMACNDLHGSEIAIQMIIHLIEEACEAFEYARQQRH